MGNVGLYAKAVFAALMAAVTALYGYLNGENGNMTDAEWTGVVLAALTALGVYLFPNAAASDKQRGLANEG